MDSFGVPRSSPRRILPGHRVKDIYASPTDETFPLIYIDYRQCVAMIQLTPEEAVKYQDCPVVLDFKSGFYVFPVGLGERQSLSCLIIDDFVSINVQPNEDNIVKMAIHSAGYVHPINGISTPRTSSSDPRDGTAIPRASLNELREQLRQVYPDLAERPFSATRLCW